WRFGPKGALRPPQMSPPVAVRFCAARFAMSQSTTKLVLLSVQLRATLFTSRFVGVRAEPNRTVLPDPRSAWPATYRFTLILKAVLPVPKTSHAKPLLGLTSFQCTPGVFGVVMLRFGAYSVGARCISGKLVAK